MSYKDYCKFNLPLKGEDAEPFASENVLAVADGFGGSGASLHTFPVGPEAEKRFYEAAFGDFEEGPEGSEQAKIVATAHDFVKEILTPKEAGDVTVTRKSAFVASRIVIARAVYCAVAYFDGRAPIPSLKKLDAEHPLPCSVKKEEPVPEVKKEEAAPVEEKPAEPVPEAAPTDAILVKTIVEAPDGTTEESTSEVKPEETEASEEGTVSIPVAKAGLAPEEEALSEQDEEDDELFDDDDFDDDDDDDDDATPPDYGDEDHREKWARFVEFGMIRLAEEFKLEKGPYKELALLPSTFAMIHLDKGVDNAEVYSNFCAIWAGDSRCYCLTDKGIFLLSQDDEDHTGTVTNFFHIEDPKNPDDRPMAKLNLNSGDLPDKCVVFCVSDGVFDPFGYYEHLGVANAMLSSLMAANSLEEWVGNNGNVFNLYKNKYQEDDTTLALRTIGFASFEEVKAYFAPLAEKTTKLFTQLNENVDALSRLGRDNSDIIGYIRSRTKLVYDRGALLLVDAYLNGEKDIALTPAIRAEFDKFAEGKEVTEDEIRAYLLPRLASFLKEYPFMIDAVMLRAKEGEPLEKAIAALKYAAERLETKEVEKKVYDELVDSLVVTIKASHDTILGILLKAFCGPFLPKKKKWESAELRAGLLELIKVRKDVYFEEIVVALETNYNETSIVDKFYNPAALERYRNYKKDEEKGVDLTGLKQNLEEYEAHVEDLLMKEFRS